MDGSSVNCDQIIAELINMGFEFSQVLEAVKAVGPSLEAAIEFILDDSQRSALAVSCSSDCLNQSGKALGKRDLESLNPSRKRFKQSKISEFQSAGRSDLVRHTSESDTETKSVERRSNSLSSVGSFPKLELVMANTPSYCEEEEDIGQDWELKARNLMQKHFGYSSLKSFQKEALAAWVAHQDCLVLAATGSGKSLCFQIPALLTGKVVVVISPLISLMHDQCLKLAKHGVSCCFLGSGQTDRSVEQKAMEGMYGIIYICPETLVRLIKPLQSLAANRGIALFAIDEVHCISKWGHDFRPNYRRLSLLRENFRAGNLKCLKFDIPLMALTATATIQVREDILNSLHMSDKTRVVLTSFFRPNLRFSVQHSSTSYLDSYEKDFRELIDTYNKKKGSDIAQNLILPDVEDTSYTLSSSSESEDCLDNIEDDSLSGNSNRVSFQTAASVLNERKLSVEFLEDECDTLQDVDDFDVSCSEFCGQLPMKEGNNCEISDASYLRKGSEESPELFQEPLGLGPTIIYAPTRNETMLISEFLCRFGIKAAAYHAKLPKSHLRQVHKEFHENKLQVVAATVAFGMGIDKSNVRRIIHYGWPQSLEAYYQEAGRAGRDGKLADCVLYANLLRTPTLLPSKRSEEQTRRAYRMLSDCFRYGINASCCRAETLVQYFGEEFSQKKCLMCDVCIKGPPELQNLKDEAKIFVQAIAAQYERRFADSLYSHVVAAASGVRLMEMRTLKIVINKLLLEQKYAGYGYLWWRGFARILEDKGFIREGADMIHVQINVPEPTQLGLEFLQSEQPFNVYPEADMLLSAAANRPYSTSAEWGRGWADPEIRRQRLHYMPYPRRGKIDTSTVRSRLTAKLLKKK